MSASPTSAPSVHGPSHALRHRLLGLVIAAVAVAGSVSAAPDMIVAVADSADPVNAGAAFSYTVTVENQGDTAASVVAVATNLPTGVTGISVGPTADWSCSPSGNTVSCSYTANSGSFAAGGSSSIVIAVTAPADPPSPFTITANATVSTTTAESDTTNNDASETTTLTPEADLSVTKTDSPDPVDAGATLTYSVTVHNAGPSTAQSLSLSDNLPDSVTYVSATGTGWTCTGTDPVVCTRSSLAPGGDAPTITITVTAPDDPPSPFTITNTASVSSATDDPAAGNDSTGNVTTTVTPVADLSVTKSDSADPVDAATDFSYTLAVHNAGPSTAVNVVVEDDLPTGVTYVSKSGTGWTCTPAGGVGGTVDCTLASLAPGGDSSVTITVNAPDDGGTITNSATVSADTVDRTGGNDSASEDTEVNWVSDLVVTKTDGVTSVVPGTPISYTLTVTNDGPSQVTGATVSDSFSELLGVRWTCAVTGTGSCGVPSGRGDLDASLDLDKNAVATFTVSGWVAPDAAGTPCSSAPESSCLVNSASAAVPSGWSDHNSGNNTGTDDDTVLTPSANLFIDKHNEDIALGTPLDEVGPGQSFQYVLHVGSRGPSTLANIGLSDTFPSVLGGHPTHCAGNTEYPCWQCVPAPPLTFREAKQTDDSTGLEGVRAAAASPDGKHVYAVGGAGNQVVTLTRTLTHSTPSDTFGHLDVTDADNVTSPTSVAVSLDGMNVYVTASSTDGSTGSVVKFTRNPATGALSAPITYTLPGARDIVVSADGLHAYVAVRTSSAGSIAAFSRNPADGTLSPLSPASYTLAGATAVLLSSAGDSVYATSSSAGSVTRWTRDPATGALSGAATTSGLAGAAALALSPDGANLYAAGSNSVYTLDRSTSNGALSGLVTITDGDDGGNVDGLAGASGVVVTQDGRLVVVAGSGDGALAVLDRDTATGALAFSATITRPATLAGVTGLAATPDGAHLLSAAPTNSALSVYAVTAGAGCPTPSSDGGPSLDASITVPANGSLDFYVYTTLSPAAAVSLSNTATVTAPGDADPDTSDNSSTDTDPVTLATNLVVTNSASGGAAVPGSTYGYTIVASNQGDQQAAGSTITDTFPIYDGSSVTAGFTGTVSWHCTATGGACCTAGGAPCTGVDGTGPINRQVDLPPTGAVTFTVSGSLDPASTGDLVNSAEVATPSGIGELTPADNTATHTITVTPTGDLSVQKVHAPFEAGVDTTVTYTITAHNNGPSTAVGETVSDPFPIFDGSSVIAGFTSGTVSWTCAATGGGCCTSGGACTVPSPVTGDALGQQVDLPPGASVVFTVTGTVEADPTAAVLTNTATVGHASVTDAVLVNNTATDAVVLKQSVDLAITVDDGTTSATPGEDVLYTVQVSNSGPNDAIQANVEDVFPDDLTNVRWTCSAVSPVPGDLTFRSADRRLGALDGADAVAVSPDGKQVYVAAGGADAVAVYARETTIGPYFGQLAFLEAEVDGVNDSTDVGLTVAGLHAPSSVVLSPDGRHVYLTAVDNSDTASPKATVVTFSRDLNSGLLSYVETETDGVDDPGDGGGPVTGMAGAEGVTVSPDGKHVYVAGGAGHAVAIFARDTSTGRLSFVDAAADTGFEVRSVAASPDGHQVYATSGDSLVAYARDVDPASPGYGTLTVVDSEDNGSGGVDGLADASAVILSPDGHHVYVAGTGDSSIAVFVRAGDGTVTYAGKVTDGDGPTDGIAGVTGLAIAPDGEHLVAAGTADAGGTLAVFRRVKASGLLSFQELHQNGLPPSPEVPADGLAGVRGVAVTPDGRHVLTAAVTDNALDSFERRAPDPNLLFLEAETDGVDGVDGLFGARSVAVNPGTGGKWVYAVGYGENALAVFARDAGKGATPDTRGLHLVFKQAYKNGVAGITGLNGPAAVLASPDGGHVYVASETGNSLAVFRQNVDGTLTELQTLTDGSAGVDGLSGAAALAFDPSGEYLYAAGQYEDSVATFRRVTSSASPDYGKLTYLGKQTNGVDGVSGLDGVVGLAVADDGRHLVAVSRVDDAAVVFQRNTSLDDAPCSPSAAPVCGRLRYIQTVTNGSGGADGLDQAMAVAISPDGDHVYVAGANQDALVAFRRNTDPSSANFGRLSFMTVYMSGVDGVTGLDGARAVTLSPDGRYVYVAAEFDNALTAFERVTDVTSPTYGALSLFEVRRDGADGVDGLNQAYSVAASRDGRDVYVVGLGDNALAAFQRRSGSSCTASGSGNVFDTVDVAFAGTVTYTVQATLRPGARGVPCPGDPSQQCLVDTATATQRTGDVDTDPSDNTDTDDDTVLVPRADLGVVKSDSIDTVVTGDTASYTITVQNAGPSNATNDPTWPEPLSAVLVDSFGPDFDSATWTCLAVGSGSLDFLEAYRDGVGATDLLAGASAVAVAVDPDGGGPLTEYVYATAISDGALTMFKRNRTTGALEVLQQITNGSALASGTVTGLRGASDVEVSPDGMYLYVTGQVDDALVVFKLVPGSGDNASLDLVGVHGGLDEANSVAISPDGATVYVTSANDDSLRAFQTGAGGALTLIDSEHDGVDDPSDGGDTVDGLDGASSVVVSPDGEHVYATGANDGAVAVFTRAGDGTISFLEVKGSGSSAGLEGARALAFDPTGTHLYVAGSASNAVVALRRTTTPGPDFGRLVPLSPPALYVDGVGGVTGIRNPRDLLVSPDGLHVYVAGQGSDSVALFNRDAGTGRLSLIELRSSGTGSVEGLNGVASLALSPDGSSLYTAALVDSAVAVFARPADSSCPASGSGDLNVPINVAALGRVVFTVNAHVRAGATGSPCLADPGSICVSNTATVLTTPSGSPGALDPESGNDASTDEDFLRRRADLSITKSDGFVEYDGLLDPLGMALSPAGNNLYVAGSADSAVGIFRRNSATGALTFRAAVRNGENGVSGLGGAAGVAVSPDGRSVYVAAPNDNSLVVFTRDPDPASGLLTFQEVQTNGVAGAAGLLGARGVAVSPDGAHVYVTGRNSNAIAVFSRTTSGDDRGRLVFRQLAVNGAGGVVGLIGPTAVAVSADGATVYAAAPGSSSVVAFARDTNSESGHYGELTFLQRLQDGSGGADGLAGVAALALSPDGTFLYAAGRSDDKVAVFARSTSTGMLTAQAPASSPGAAGLRVSPDGAHVYVSDAVGNAVRVFSRDLGTGALTAHGVVVNGDVQGSPPDQVVVQGLIGATVVTVSPDGADVYVAAVGDDAVTAFTRTTAPSPPEDFGQLGFVATYLDGGGGAAPGDPAGVTYTIVVSNAGPSDVVKNPVRGWPGAMVEDSFAASFESVSWTCTAEGGASCVSLGTGDIDQEVSIPAGGRVIYTAGGVLRSEATGRLINTATVTAPPGVIDPDLDNNSATDDDTVMSPVSDLVVNKTSGPGPMVPGADATYVITVANTGPSVAPGNSIYDPMPEAFTDVSWSCFAVPPPGLLQELVQQPLGLDAVTAATLSQDGRFVYAAGTSLGLGAVAVLPRDTRSGLLGAPVQILKDGDVQDGTVLVDGLAGAADLVVSSDDAFIYVAGSGDDAVAVLARDAGDGTLLFSSLVRDGVGAVNGIGQASALALSPDGTHLYAAGPADNAVATFARSSGTGALTFVQFNQDASLLGTSDVAVTPDGSHVLATGGASDSVVIFSRNAGTGALTRVSVVTEGDVQIPDPSDPATTVTVTGLAGAAALAVSPDGSRVWVAGPADQAVAAFTRSPSTGALAFDGAVVQGDIQRLDPTDPATEVTADGLAAISDLATSPDGLQVYVAGTDGAADSAVSVFTWRNGQLTFLASEADTGGLLGGGRLTVSADGHHLYAGGAAPTPLAFGRLPGSTCGTGSPGSLLDGLDLVPGGVATYRVRGTVLPAATGDVTNTVTVSAGRTVRDPVLVNNTASDTTTLMRDADVEVTKDDGLTEAVAGEWVTYTVTVTNHGPSDVRGLALDDEPPLFPASAAGFASGSLSWDCTSPHVLELLQTVSGSDPGAAALAGARWTAVSPDGRSVYVTGRDADAVTVFQRESTPGPTFGTLTLVAIVHNGDTLASGVVSGLAGAAGVAVSADGANVYVAGADDGAVVAFDRDPDTGELDLVEPFFNGDMGSDGLIGATALTISPDGAQVYVASQDDNTVVALARDASTGALTFIERKRDGLGSVPLNTLTGARHLVLSPDGHFLYVAAQTAGAIASFQRDPATGALTFASVVHQGDLQGPLGDQIQVNGLDLVRSLAMSPGGAHLYAASLADDSVTLFTRDPMSGRLSWAATYADGDGAISGLDGATAVIVSPDGARVYALGLNSDAVAVFQRSWADGRLRFLEQLALPAPSPLDGAAGLASSPDDAQLYVAGQVSGALVALGHLDDGVCSAAAASSDSLHLSLDLEAGASAVVAVTGQVHPSARGTIVNSATATMPADVSDSIPGNNTGIDDDTEIAVVNALAVTKTDNADSVAAGLSVTYTVTVTNAGPSDALGAQVTDVLPSQLLAPTWTCTASSGSSCSPSGSGSISDVVDILVGGVLTYSVQGQVDPAFVGTMTNTATVTPAAGASDPAPGDNSAADADAVVPVTNISVSKSNGVDAVIPGTVVSYTIVVSNAGPSTALGTAKDSPPNQLLPATVAWTCTPSAGASCTASGSGSISDAVTIPPAGSATYALTGTVDPSVLGTIANTASLQLAAGYTDPNPSDNISTDSDPLTPRADLTVSKSDDVDPVVSAGALAYTVTVANLGPSDARDVAATEALPGAVTFASTTGCAEDAGGVPTCSLGVVAAGAQKQYTVAVTVNPDAQGTITNTVSVASSTTDPVPIANNTASEDTEVLGRVDLSIIKTDSADPVEAGDTFTYDISIANAGPQTARNVVVTDTLPGELDGAAVTGCASGDWTDCGLGDLAAGGTRQLQLTVSARDDAWGTVTNHAEVSTQDHDGTPANNAVDEDTTIVGVADLAVTKDDGLWSVEPGDALTYTITVTNAGPGTPASVTVTDLLPDALVGASWSCVASGTAVCTLSGVGNLVDSIYLPPGDTVTYSVNATVDPALDALTTEVSNTAEVAVPAEFVDHEPANDTAADTDPIGLFADGFETGDTSHWSSTASILATIGQGAAVNPEGTLASAEPQAGASQREGESLARAIH